MKLHNIQPVIINNYYDVYAAALPFRGKKCTMKRLNDHDSLKEDAHYYYSNLLIFNKKNPVVLLPATPALKMPFSICILEDIIRMDSTVQQQQQCLIFMGLLFEYTTCLIK